MWKQMNLSLWGKLMETLSEGGEDETPLQVKLNGVATIIGKIGLGFAVVAFVVLCIRFVIGKATAEGHIVWLRKLFDDPKIGCIAYNLGNGRGMFVLEIGYCF
ncbi:unnamed protein product [Eruca vesicaria subsp. sativa]|uniref:Uncharacterized protein n=1 Tax=Eruca vesicaria subsp. sativa TaxID=29727 RepID=A0ABC8L0F0_ERUVS|nr:unnamed protein product [Eruca vesicaria subsp. sativa]